MQKSLKELIKEFQEIAISRMAVNPIESRRFHKLDEVKKLLEILNKINNKINDKDK